MSTTARSPAGDRRAADAEAWQERLIELMSRHRVPGATLGILKDGSMTATGAGVLSRATGVDVTPDSLFQIGSIT
ncbi:MAG TPA: serine hydrolase, partial [Gaiella sp.]|uniref:serine hydrolase n=1 Tax=Gaiella sp. TaxID=2663207 RepID=UPI002D7ECF96